MIVVAIQTSRVVNPQETGPGRYLNRGPPPASFAPLTSPRHPADPVADLEKHAIKRDKRFLLRLFLFLAVGGLAGFLLFVKMTSPEVATCAAGSFGAAADEGE